MMPEIVVGSSGWGLQKCGPLIAHRCCGGRTNTQALHTLEWLAPGAKIICPMVKTMVLPNHISQRQTMNGLLKDRDIRPDRMDLTEFITCCDALCVVHTCRQAEVQVSDIAMRQVRVVENGCASRTVRCSFSTRFGHVCTSRAGEVDGDVECRTCCFCASIPKPLWSTMQYNAILVGAVPEPAECDCI